MNPILPTLWLLGATLLVLAAKSEPTLGQCYSCGEVLLGLLRALRWARRAAGG